MEDFTDSSFLGDPLVEFAFLPPDAPEILAKNTIAVPDPKYVEALVDSARRRKVQSLITRYEQCPPHRHSSAFTVTNHPPLSCRYMNQLLYGCQSRECHTPTCWTARRNLSVQDKYPNPKSANVAGARRKMTVLSARILATHLATQPNPYGALCPGKPVVAISIDGKAGKKVRRVSGSIQDGKDSKEPSGPEPLEKPENEGEEGPMYEKAVRDLGVIDPKSFTQQLYNTDALKKLDWLSIPPPTSILKFWRNARMGTPREESEPKVTPKEESLETSQDIIQKERIRKPLDRNRSDSVTSRSEIMSKHSEQLEKAMMAQNTRMKELLAVTPVSTKNPTHPPHMKDMLITPIQQTPKKTPKHHFSQVQPLEPPAVLQQRQKHSSDQHHYTQHHDPHTTPSRGPTNSQRLMPAVPNEPKPPQTLSHLTLQTVQTLMDYIKAQKNTASREAAVAFTRQSIFYCLSNPDAALQCFTDPSLFNSGDITLDPESTDAAFRLLMPKFEDLIYKSLIICLGELFVPGLDDRTYEPSMHKENKPMWSKSRLRRDAAAHLIILTLHALAASLPKSTMEDWSTMRYLRSRGRIAADFDFEHELAEKLITRLVKGLDFWTCAMGTDTQDYMKRYFRNCANAEMEARREAAEKELGPELAKDVPLDIGGSGWGLAAASLEWARSTFLKNWDGNEAIRQGSVSAGALRLIRVICKCPCPWLVSRTDQLADFAEGSSGLPLEYFQTPALSDRIDAKDTPYEWFLYERQSIHLLDHPYIFPSSALVTYFRAINLAHMTKAYEEATHMRRLQLQMSMFIRDPENRDRTFDPLRVPLGTRLDIAKTAYLIVEISRESVLEDALNQLFKREKRELMRPLKVRFTDEGEEGVDHGGVQQEFFILALREALKPEYGMFTTDPRTRMTWFQVNPLEPLHKFELLGLLFSLAVYNGITLPVAFPRMFYRHLLAYPVDKIEHIEDGFPELARGLRQLLSWEDGDVGDVFMRTYEFGYDYYGQVRNIDIMKAKAAGLEVILPMIYYRDPGRSDRGMPVFPASSVGGARSTIADALDEVDSDSDTENRPPKSTATMDWDALDEDDNVSQLANSIGGISTQPPKSHISYKPPMPLPTTSDALRQAETTDDQEPVLVTNANRHQYVRDYIHWLGTLSINPQMKAFKEGFRTLLPEKALTLFTPYSLQTLIEGHQDIDIVQLERHTRYDDGYSPDHPLIREFWDLVRTYDKDERRQLLEFVTASDRVPVGGLGTLVFVIQRNGPDTERLPTSLTCFGRLLLPEYELGTGKLRRKMKIALENARGFGSP